MPLQGLQRTPRSRTNAQTLIVHKKTMAAPTSGLTSAKPIAEMSYADAVILRNFLVKPFGLEIRAGYQIHVNDLEFKVNTLVPHQASRPANDRLWAITYEGVFDVTGRTNNMGVKPPLDETFAVQTPDVTDTWSWIPFATLGENYTCMVSEFNGYYTYDATNGWVLQNANVSGPAGFDPLTFDYITSWKRRLWFVPQNSTKVYYLPVNSITGVMQEFDFGPYMRQGGEIKQLVSWTRDGGDGIDDFLVVIGSEGDILVYQGTDPANADTFSMVGVWDVGKVPEGRRFARKAGGDVKVLCESGLVDLAELFTGALNLSSEVALGYPIQTTLAARVSESVDEAQWELNYYAREELFLVKEPIGGTFQDPQLWSANLHARGWSHCVRYPIQTVGEFDGDLYGADNLGNVWQLFIGDVDKLDFDSTFDDIIANIQVGFSDFEMPNNKKFQMVQPTFQSPVAPAVQIQMKTEYDLNIIPGAPIFGGSAESGLWDQGLWDVAFFAGQAGTYQSWAGVNGVGRFGSLAMNVLGNGGTIFAHWTVSFEEGGMV